MEKHWSNMFYITWVKRSRSFLSLWTSSGGLNMQSAGVQAAKRNEDPVVSACFMGTGLYALIPRETFALTEKEEMVIWEYVIKKQLKELACGLNSVRRLLATQAQRPGMSSIPRILLVNAEYLGSCSDSAGRGACHQSWWCNHQNLHDRRRELTLSPLTPHVHRNMHMSMHNGWIHTHIRTYVHRW